MNVTEKNCLQYGIFFIILLAIFMRGNLLDLMNNPDYLGYYLAGFSDMFCLILAISFLRHFQKERRRRFGQPKAYSQQ